MTNTHQWRLERGDQGHCEPFRGSGSSSRNSDEMQAKETASDTTMAALRPPV